ncbi:PfkB family carbohydrate kinase [uncultured Clostridium sp.]|nr:PfkB family carbohydrate kinase [uncultured Clostridium sp.]
MTKIYEKIKQDLDNYYRSNDSNIWRNKNHIEMPFGLVNDPNGLSYFDGKYHIFFQWNPFGCEHKTKHWALVKTTDFVNFTKPEIILKPEDWFDKNGCYSGGAYVKGDTLKLFYTGNVKDENNERESYQCIVDYNKDGTILKDLNINTDMTVEKGSTTMALVGIDADGERNFDFLRGSDGEYSFDNVDTSKITATDIIHFGSATGFLDGELKKTYFKLLDYAKEKNIYVSFDPNYRDALIKDDMLAQFVEDSKAFLRHSDFTKLSDEELTLITGEKDLDAGVKALHDLGVKVVTITLGSKGTYLSVAGENVIIPSIKIKQVDSTGAGDSFVGAVLKQVSDIEDKKNISMDKWKEIIAFANKVGAITCTNYGAIASMPTLAEVNAIQ